jgi:hypothetical protein
MRRQDQKEQRKLGDQRRKNDALHSRSPNLSYQKVHLQSLLFQLTCNNVKSLIP